MRPEVRILSGALSLIFMRAESYSLGPIDTNMVVIGSLESSEVLVFDAPEGALEILKSLGLTPIALFLTHSHWDHIGGLAEIHEHYRIPVYVHSKDRDNVEKPGSDRLPLFTSIKGFLGALSLFDEQEFNIGGMHFKVIETPGHSPGSVVFYFEKEKILVSGDTVFKSAIGRVDLPHSSPSAMRASLKRLAALPSDIRVFPGHGEQTVLGTEKNRWKRYE